MHASVNPCTQALTPLVKTRNPRCSFVSYVRGANVAGFIKVADAMLDQGVV